MEQKLRETEKLDLDKGHDSVIHCFEVCPHVTRWSGVSFGIHDYVYHLVQYSYRVLVLELTHVGMQDRPLVFHPPLWVQKKDPRPHPFLSRMEACSFQQHIGKEKKKTTASQTQEHLITLITIEILSD